MRLERSNLSPMRPGDASARLRPVRLRFARGTLGGSRVAVLDVGRSDCWLIWGLADSCTWPFACWPICFALGVG